MAANSTTPFGVNQVDTENLAPGAVPPAGREPADALFTPPPADTPAPSSSIAHPTVGTGVAGENVVWQARYALRNFVGRITARVLLTLVWAGLAYYTWSLGHNDLTIATTALGIGLGLLWLTLIYRIAHARLGHFYQLTTRRLFVSTGVMNRRRDQLELLRVEDVYTKQSLFDRWMGLGTVVVVSTEDSLPSVAMPGVKDPKRVMDLIWHHARSERDQRSVKVQEI
jgi:membrane protein YdbS with pleckstrin-like domain